MINKILLAKKIYIQKHFKICRLIIQNKKTFLKQIQRKNKKTLYLMNKYIIKKKIKLNKNYKYMKFNN